MKLEKGKKYYHINCSLSFSFLEFEVIDSLVNYGGERIYKVKYDGKLYYHDILEREIKKGNITNSVRETKMRQIELHLEHIELRKKIIEEIKEGIE